MRINKKSAPFFSIYFCCFFLNCKYKMWFSMRICVSACSRTVSKWALGILQCHIFQKWREHNLPFLTIIFLSFISTHIKAQVYPHKPLAIKIILWLLLLKLLWNWTFLGSNSIWLGFEYFSVLFWSWLGSFWDHFLCSNPLGELS